VRNVGIGSNNSPNRRRQKFKRHCPKREARSEDQQHGPAGEFARGDGVAAGEFVSRLSPQAPRAAPGCHAARIASRPARSHGQTDRAISWIDMPPRSSMTSLNPPELSSDFRVRAKIGSRCCGSLGPLAHFKLFLQLANTRVQLRRNTHSLSPSLFPCGVKA